VKAEGPSWTVYVRKRRRRISQGVWAPAERIERVREQLERERATPQYARRRDADRRRRAREQSRYVADFEQAIVEFLAFEPPHDGLALVLARTIAEHATPVGSGTVARTQRIPLPRRAEAATIAWLRHQTTGYDGMSIPRVAGRRREVRRALAKRSRALLDRYRRGLPVDPATCSLRQGLLRAGAEPDLDELPFDL
jgi:hypothetical protein